jgi:hypothetical protein
MWFHVFVLTSVVNTALQHSVALCTSDFGIIFSSTCREEDEEEKEGEMGKGRGELQVGEKSVPKFT